MRAVLEVLALAVPRGEPDRTRLLVERAVHRGREVEPERLDGAIGGEPSDRGEVALDAARAALGEPVDGLLRLADVEHGELAAHALVDLGGTEPIRCALHRHEAAAVARALDELGQHRLGGEHDQRHALIGIVRHQFMPHGIGDTLRVDVKGRGAAVLLARAAVAVPADPAGSDVAGLAVRGLIGALRHRGLDGHLHGPIGGGRVPERPFVRRDGDRIGLLVLARRSQQLPQREVGPDVHGVVELVRQHEHLTEPGRDEDGERSGEPCPQRLVRQDLVASPAEGVDLGAGRLAGSHLLDRRVECALHRHLGAFAFTHDGRGRGVDGDRRMMISGQRGEVRGSGQFVVNRHSILPWGRATSASLVSSL